MRTGKLVLSCSLTGLSAFGAGRGWRTRLTTFRRWRRSRLASGLGSTSRAAGRATLPVAAGFERNAKSQNP